MSTQQNTTISQNHHFPSPDPARRAAAFDLAFVAPVLSVDLDNVIRDQIGSIIHAARRRWGVELERSEFDRWDPPLGHRCGISEEEFTAWAWSDPAIFNTAAPLPGVQVALGCLARRYRVVVNTSTRHPELTRPWLDRWSVPYHLILHTNDKSSLAFDWHIEDNPATLLALAAAGRRVIRWALPWNAHLVQYRAVAGWNQVEAVLDEGR